MIFSAAAFTVRASIFLPIPGTSTRKLVASSVKRAVEINCEALSCPCWARAETIACLTSSDSRPPATGLGVVGAADGGMDSSGSASPAETGSRDNSGTALAGTVGKGITSCTASACVRCAAAKAAEPLTAWLSTTGPDCITGLDPNGDLVCGEALAGVVVRVPEDEGRGGADGVRGAD